MFQDPQSLFVLVVVAAAATYLSRRAWRAIFGRGTHCGSGCGKCGDKPLVQLDFAAKPPLSKNSP